jgi:hypothetical protein
MKYIQELMMSEKIKIDKLEYLYIKKSIYDIVCEISKIKIAHNDIDDNLKEDLESLKLTAQLSVKKLENNYKRFDLDNNVNKICGNCKYYEHYKPDALCNCHHPDNEQEYYCNHLMEVTVDFYCNKWELKK